jgi:hypothetical protein
MFICRKNFEKFSRVKTGQWQNIRKCLGNLWPAALILGIDHKRRRLICIVQNGVKVNDQPKLAFKSPSAVPLDLDVTADISRMRLIADKFAHDFQRFRYDDKCFRVDLADNLLEPRELRKCYHRVQNV